MNLCDQCTGKIYPPDKYSMGRQYFCGLMVEAERDGIIVQSCSHFCKIEQKPANK